MRGALGVPLNSYGCGALSGVSFALPYDVADVVMSLLALTCMMFVAFCRTVLLAHGLLLGLSCMVSVLAGANAHQYPILRGRPERPLRHK